MMSTPHQPAVTAPPTRFARWLEPQVLVTIGVLVVLIYLVVGPLLVLVFSAVRDTDGRLPFEESSSWTFANVAQVVLDPKTYTILADTAIYSFGSLIITFSISLALAWLVERTDLPLRTLVYVLIVSSLAIPTVILGISWSLLLNPVNGTVNLWIRGLTGFEGSGPFDVFTMPGLVVAQAISMVPITFLLVAGAFRVMDASMEEAASTSGARFSQTIRWITLPLTTPAVLAALVFMIVSVVESFDMPLVIGLRAGIEVLSTHIYLQIQPPGVALPNVGVASVFGLLLLFIALIPLYYYNRIVARSERYATITGRGTHPRRLNLGVWKYPVTIAVFAFLAASFVVPVLILIWASLQPFLSAPTLESLTRLNIGAYVALPQDPTFITATINTLILGTAVGLGAMVLGLVASWIMVRSRSRLVPVLDVFTYLPHAFPGVIIGLAILLIYLYLPLPIYGSIWVLAIAIITQLISLATRQMRGGVTQVQRSLEEAAETSGASWFQTMRYVTLPLVWPSMLNGFLLIFLIAIKTLSLTLVLYGPDSVVLPTLIWVRWNTGEVAGASVVGVVMVVITVVLAIGVRRFDALGSSGQQ